MMAVHGIKDTKSSTGFGVVKMAEMHGSTSGNVVGVRESGKGTADIRSALSNRGGWKSLIVFFVLALAWVAGFSSRLFAVIRFESIIHEFDPW